MHPGHSQSSWVCPPLWSPPPQTPSPACVDHILTGAWSNSITHSCKENWALPHCTPTEAISCGEPLFSVLITVLRVLFNAILSRLLPFRGMGVLIIEASVSLFNCEPAVISTTVKVASSPFTVCGSMDHGLSRGLWRQSVLWTLACLLEIPFTPKFPSPVFGTHALT